MAGDVGAGALPDGEFRLQGAEGGGNFRDGFSGGVQLMGGQASVQGQSVQAPADDIGGAETPGDIRFQPGAQGFRIRQKGDAQGPAVFPIQAERMASRMAWSCITQEKTTFS